MDAGSGDAVLLAGLVDGLDDAVEVDRGLRADVELRVLEGEFDAGDTRHGRYLSLMACTQWLQVIPVTV
ncbi:hypothetical protein [Sedimentibacter sp. B4]|uniref:hypothetical protein n=1 Tax=Sedimentibacter sp. B4 TaxID=304766 RepID=UPI0004BB3F70|nr:hypothetical protein [Sedimentibacter sp. B4]